MKYLECPRCSFRVLDHRPRASGSIFCPHCKMMWVIPDKIETQAIDSHHFHSGLSYTIEQTQNLK
jgi:hypothetical protein